MFVAPTKLGRGGGNGRNCLVVVPSVSLMQYDFILLSQLVVSLKKAHRCRCVKKCSAASLIADIVSLSCVHDHCCCRHTSNL
jgi:hypothetical protein